MTDQTYHQKKIIASLKSVYREADSAFQQEIRGDFRQTNPIEALRQLGEDAIDMHPALFAKSAVKTTMTRVVDCSNALEQFLLDNNLVRERHGFHGDEGDLDKFYDALNQSFKDGSLSQLNSDTESVQEKMRNFLKARLEQLVGKPEAQTQKAKIGIIERISSVIVGRKPGKIQEGRVGRKHTLIKEGTLKGTAKRNALASLLEELDKAIVIAGNTMEKTFKAQDKHFLSYDDYQDIWDMLDGNNASKKATSTEISRDDSIKHHSLDQQEKDFHDILNALNDKREEALETLRTQDLTEHKPEPKLWAWRALGLFFAPVMLPLLTLMGAIRAITSFRGDEFLRMPREYLQAAGLRLSAIQKLYNLDQAVTKTDGSGIDYNDLVWDHFLNDHHGELLSDMARSPVSTSAQPKKSGAGPSFDGLKRALADARRYGQAMDRVVKAFKTHSDIAADYVGARKTTRLFLNELQRNSGKAIAFDFMPSTDAQKVLTAMQASHRGRGYVKEGGKITFQGAKTADLLQKRIKVNGVAAPGVASDKAKRSQLNIGLDMIAAVNPKVYSAVGSAEERAGLASLYKQNIGNAGITYKQRLIMKLAKAGAFLYAIGCALQIAGGLMFIFAFPGAPIVALAFGLLFTFTYNWWLTKFALPQIMMGMLNGKKGLLNDLENNSVAWWPWLILKQIVLAPFQMVRVLLGVALMPLIWVLAQPLNVLSQFSQFPGKGARFYQFMMANVFGVLAKEKADTQLWKSQLQTEIRTDALLTIMFALCGIGTALILTGTGPMVVGMLVIVAGLGTMVYKVTGGLTSFVNEQNQKKELSKARKVGLALLFSLVSLMGLANGALVVPGIDIFKTVLGYVGLSAYAMVVAVPVILGTVVAMTALMLVSFADFLKKQNILQGLKAFFVDRLWYGKLPANESKEKVKTPQDTNTDNPHQRWTFSWFKFIVAAKRQFYRAARVASFTAVVAAGTWGVVSICLTMAESIVSLSSVFTGGQLPIFIALFVAMIGLFAEVLTVLWSEIAAAASNPLQTGYNLLLALSNAVEWTYSLPKVGNFSPRIAKKISATQGENKNSSALFKSWYESPNVLIKILKIVFFIPCFVLKKVLENLFVTTFQLVVIVPFLLVESFFKAFPSVFALLLNGHVDRYSVPNTNSPDGDHTNANSQFNGFLRARAILIAIYVQFTRLGNATGNGLLVDASVQHAFHAPVVTVVSVASAFMNSFSALFVTMRNKKVDKAIDDAIDSRMEKGSDTSAVLDAIAPDHDEQEDDSDDEDETDSTEPIITENQPEPLTHEEIAFALNLEQSHKRSIFESAVIKAASKKNDTVKDLNDRDVMPKHFFPADADKKVVDHVLKASFFKSGLSDSAIKLNESLLRDQFGYSDKEAEHWVSQCAQIAHLGA